MCSLDDNGHRLELKDAVKAVIALGSGEANMVVANSADIAMAVSRDLDAKIIWTIQAYTHRLT